jgi:hypothetical protein
LADVDPARPPVGLGLHVRDVTKDSRTESDAVLRSDVAPLLMKPSARAICAELEQAVLRDLLGPAGGPEEEVNEDSIRDRYLVEVVAPLGRRLPPEQDDELAVTEARSPDEAQPESNMAAAMSMFPSSIGLSFIVSGDAPAIVVGASWGRDHREQSEMLVTARTGAPMVWKREQVAQTSPPIPLRVGRTEPWARCDEQPRWWSGA